MGGKQQMRYWVFFCLFLVPLGQTYALFFDGKGFFGLQGQSLWRPGFSGNYNSYTKIQKDMHLILEGRSSDQLSFFLDLSVFQDPESRHLGDKTRTDQCFDQKEPCKQQHQNISNPHYEDIVATFKEIYIRYASDLCLLEIGRRARHIALGAIINDGEKPFAYDSSLYEGVSCLITPQRYQKLSLAFGYDQLVESGSTFLQSIPETQEDQFGPTASSDDVHQIFAHIKLDDRLFKAQGDWKNEIGLYFSWLFSEDRKHPKPVDGTSVQYVDLFTAFHLNPFSFKNEFVLRVGHSADPSWALLGGRLNYPNDIISKSVHSMAVTGELSWVIYQEGSYRGPKEYRQGDHLQHSVFFGYAFAPGDEDGYYANYDFIKDLKDEEKEKAQDTVGLVNRDAKAKALAFHRAFQPALLLFRGFDQDMRDLQIDGVFHPARVMNTALFSLGYRYDSIAIGHIEAKFTTAFLNKSMPIKVKDYFENRKKRPFGYYGTGLGYELDVSYHYFIDRHIELQVEGAFALPGEAWRLRADDSLKNSYLIQTGVVFRF